MPTDISSSSTETFDSQVQAPAGGDPRTSASVRNPMQNIVNRVRFAWMRLQEVVGSFLPLGSLFPVAASVASSTFTIAGHGLSGNDPVRLWSIGGSVPAPLAMATTYYVVSGSLTSNTFQLSATSGGSAISLSNVGSGAIYAAKQTSTTISQTVANITANLLGSNNTWTGSNSFNSSVTVASLSLGVGSSYTRLAQSTPLIAYSGTTPTIVPRPIGPGTPTGGGVYWISVVSGGGSIIGFELDVPNGVEVTSVSQNIKPGSGHSAFPGGEPTMPTLLLVQVDASGVGTQLGTTTTDASATAGAYETTHSLTVTTSFTIDRSTFTYYSILTTESGSNWVANTLIHRPSVTWIGQGNLAF